MHLNIKYFFCFIINSDFFKGQQHYNETEFLHNMTSVEERKERDKQKLELCEKQGITLVQVPYWWNKKTDSLAATIQNKRPDLLPTLMYSEPAIPLSKPATKPKNESINKNISHCVYFCRFNEICINDSD